MNNEQPANPPLTQRWITAGWMLLLPVVSFATAMGEEFTPTHQEAWSFWLLLVDFRNAGWFALPVPAAIVLSIVVLLRPGLASVPTVRVGLYVALALALSYCIAVAGASFVIGLVPAAIALTVLAVFRGVVKSEKARTVSSLIGLLIAFVLSGALVGNGSGGLGAIVLVVLIPSGPFVCAWILAGLLAKTAAEEPPRWSYIAAATTLIGTWYFTISRALEQYNELPPQPDCYVATAAASGHKRLVRSRDGFNGLPVNTQLQTLKAGELVLSSIVPGVHRLLRRGYDRFGPQAASAMRRSPFLADLAFVLLLPAHLATHLALRLMLSPIDRSRITKIYRPSST